MTTINLDLALELQSVCKEKDITMPESCCWWCKGKNCNVHYVGYVGWNVEWGEKTIAPAYLLDELMEWLPIMRTSENYTQGLAVQVEKDYNYNSFHNNIPPETMQWKARFESLFTVFKEPTWEDKTTTPKFLSFTDTNPANAACKLLIYLIKEGLI